MRSLLFLVFLVLLITPTHSSAEKKIPMPTVTVSTSDAKRSNSVSFVGTVKYIQLEGGFYGIVAKDGTKYNPVNLDKKYQKDGLKVKCQATIKTDTVSIQMWGKIIEVKKIEKQ